MRPGSQPCRACKSLIVGHGCFSMVWREDLDGQACPLQPCQAANVEAKIELARLGRWTSILARQGGSGARAVLINPSIQNADVDVHWNRVLSPGNSLFSFEVQRSCDVCWQTPRGFLCLYKPGDELLSNDMKVDDSVERPSHNDSSLQSREFSFLDINIVQCFSSETSTKS